MIRSFRDRFTEGVFNGECPKGFPADLVKVARRKLRYLNAAADLGDLRSPPGNRLEALKGAGARPFMTDDPCLLPKACKNATEIAGTQAAHIRDGAILTQFIHWVATEAQNSLPTEIAVARVVTSLSKSASSTSRSQRPMRYDSSASMRAGARDNFPKENRATSSCRLGCGAIGSEVPIVAA